MAERQSDVNNLTHKNMTDNLTTTHKTVLYRETSGLANKIIMMVANIVLLMMFTFVRGGWWGRQI